MAPGREYSIDRWTSRWSFAFSGGSKSCGTGSTCHLAVNVKVRVIWGNDPFVRTIEGHWGVISGTGAYQDLHANGTITGTAQGFAPPELFVLTHIGTTYSD